MSIEHKIKLPFGYKDKNGTVHKDVTFGRRLTAGDMMLLDSDPRGQNQTQYWDLIHARSITAIGEKKAPIGLDVLLGLNSIDRADIKSGFLKFCEMNRDGRTHDYFDDQKVKVYFGFQKDGTDYRVVELGNMLTGKDEVDADGVSDSPGMMRECFLLGRRISKISTEDGSSSIDGPLELDWFKDLDAVDLNLLRAGARIAEAYFRIAGENVPEERNGESGDPVEEASGNDGSGSSEPAAASAADVSGDAKGSK